LGDDATLTQSGVITVTTSTTLRPVNNTKYTALVLAASGSSLGAVTLGTAFGANRIGILDPNGFDVTIDSLVDAAGGSSQFDFSDPAGDVTLNGTFDGTDVECLAPADYPRSIFRAGSGTPVIQDAVFDDIVYAAAGITISDAENVNVLRLPVGGTLLLLHVGA